MKTAKEMRDLATTPKASEPPASCVARAAARIELAAAQGMRSIVLEEVEFPAAEALYEEFVKKGYTVEVRTTYPALLVSW